MAIEKVRAYLKALGMEERIHEPEASTATVELAAAAIGTEPARIAKTLSFRSEDGCVLIVAAGDTRIDNKKFKQTFGMKARMLSPEEVEEFTGHTIGGVCPFAIEREDVKVYLDDSLKRFETIFPAAGSSRSMVELSCDELYTAGHALGWVDVCKYA